MPLTSIDTTSRNRAQQIFEFKNKIRLDKIKIISIKRRKKLTTMQKRHFNLSNGKIIPYTIKYILK